MLITGRTDKSSQTPLKDYPELSQEILNYLKEVYHKLEDPKPESNNVVLDTFKSMFSNLCSDEGLRQGFNWVGQNIDSIKDLSSLTKRWFLSKYLGLNQTSNFVEEQLLEGKVFKQLGSDTGFYAAAFKHKERNEIVIAYRGTNQNYEDFN